MSNAGLTVGGGLAGRVLDALADATTDAPGITRVAYGPGERFAHDLVRNEGEELGAVGRVDAAGNLYLTLKGSRPDLPAIVIGSHLDSVAHGGNFDGAAGVVAGLAVMAELVGQGIRLPRDLIVLATRAEEAVWFPLSYPGSLAALGLLDPQALDAKRSDSGRTLAEHMREEGFDPDAVRRGVPGIDASRIAAFVEVHIEQGPRLVAARAPAGIVTGIAGVLGFADLVAALENEWDALERDGHEATITFGRVQSDPTQHGGSRVLGELGFTLDVRSAEAAVLERIETRLQTIFAEVAVKRGVTFEPGPRFTWDPATMSPDLIGRLDRAATELQMRAPHVPSGAGHDAATFAGAGIPTAMLFVRNENGSHNPYEAMDIADLDQAIRLLLRFVTDFDNPSDQT
jgi:N-carbamoyl-L-amino-acid hydrolase